MRISQIIFLLSFFLLFSCKKDESELIPNPILKLDETISVDGISRTFHIQHPQNSKNKPLVVLLHGHGGSSDQSIGEGLGKNPQKLWLKIAQEQDFIVVVPNGELGPEETRGWNDCRTDAIGNPSTDDVKFIKNLIEKIEQEYSHDKGRVYITGISNGALMTQRLAEEIPEKIAAFASVVNSLPANSICIEGDEVISALYMNGTVDPLVPYGGGQISSNRGIVKSTDESILYWIQRNQTDTTPIIENFDNINIDDNSTVEKSTYQNGLNNSEVILYKIIGGGHTEPSKSEKYSQIYKNIVGEQNEDIEMAEEIWEFFKDKAK